MTASSSTTSASRRVRSWGAAFAIAGVIAAGAIAGYEGFLRSYGLQSYTFLDDLAVWSLQRQRIDSGDENQLIIVGGSGLLDGFSPTVMRDRLPEMEFVQLALNEVFFTAAVVRDVLSSKDARGIVVANIVAEPEPDESQRHVEYFHREWNWAHHIHTMIGARVDLALSCRGRRNSLRSVLFREVMGQPHSSNDKIHDYSLERTNILDSSRPYVREGIEHYKNLGRRDAKMFYEEPEQARQIIDRNFQLVRDLEPLVRDYQARGGKVVFVWMPLSNDLHPNYYEEVKKLGWDKWADTTEAETIHFLDVPAMRSIESFDFRHLDKGAADQYTNALIDELIRRGVIDR